QAEDGIRDGHVTGVQTCALPIWPATPPRVTVHSYGRSAPPSCAPRSSAGSASHRSAPAGDNAPPTWSAPANTPGLQGPGTTSREIGRESCREREESAGGARTREE